MPTFQYLERFALDSFLVNAMTASSFIHKIESFGEFYFPTC